MAVPGTAEPPPALVHLCRHGQVENPGNVLYSRLPGFHLSSRGQAMADNMAQCFADVPLTFLATSPLERAQETMAPIAAMHPDLPVVVDWRLIEADSAMQGQVKGPWSLRLARPANWHLFVHPSKSGWGEAFAPMAARVLAAVADAGHQVGAGGQAVLVSHQAPIWTARRQAQQRWLFNIPLMRQCALASITTFSVDQHGQVTFTAYRDTIAH